MKGLIGIAVALALAMPSVALAKSGKGKDHGHEHGKDESAAEHAPGKDDGKHGPPKFSGGEKNELDAWFKAHPDDLRQLPPGLAKQGKVPPGWQKKLAVGRPVPADLWEIRVPLPRDILVKLPPPPPGVVLVRIHDQVLKVREHTHEVLDRIGLPHPP
jgi:hypothetical protein